MLVLPIKSITETDQPLFGQSLFKLSQLQRAGIVVSDGIGITPPDFVFQTVLKHFQTSSHEVFEQRLTLVKKEISSYPIPEELKKGLSNQKNFYFNYEYLTGEETLWHLLLDKWLDQMKSRLWREGFSNDLSSAMSAQAVFFTSSKRPTCVAYMDEDSKDIIIESKVKLDLKQTEIINEVIKRSDKLLYLPQRYTFVLENSPQLVAISEHLHQTIGTENLQESKLPEKAEKVLIKSAVRIFLDTTSGFANLDHVDGVVINSSQFIVDGRLDTESLIFRLRDAALHMGNRPVIFSLPDLSPQDDIRGTLRLINHKNLMDQLIECFLFVRNKKGYHNIQILTPYVRSAQEYEQIKRELASRGVSRKGFLQFWLEISVPENVLNIDDYLKIEMDGVVLNFDNLQSLLGGYASHEGEYYKHQVDVMLRFIEPVFKTLHKAQIPILALGQTVLHPEVLDFLIEKGVYGVVGNNFIESFNLPEHLNWSENRILIKRD